MTIVINDPIYWPTIDWNRSYSYFIVASFAIVVYDWALSFGLEVDLFWRRRLSLMSLLYLGLRYIAILYSITMMVGCLPVVPLTDMVGVSENLYDIVISTLNGFNSCAIVTQVTLYGSAVINVMIGVIMITRLHAMYQQSRKMLIFLAASFLALTITNGVFVVINNRLTGRAEEFLLSGSYLCHFSYSDPLLSSVTWILGSAWEVLALCLSAWIAVKHFRELQQRPSGVAIGDCLMVLIKSHIFYFAGFVVVDIFTLISNQSIWLASSVIVSGVAETASVVQMFVLGPRLILSVREHHAELVVNSNTGIRMSEIAFQADIPVSSDNNSDV